tara:strand:+ start:80 stop:436 length:357 start_codon:yes stop_codon:yes gene_type:complete
MAFLPFIGPALSVGKFLYDELAGDPVPGIARHHATAQHVKARAHHPTAGSLDGFRKAFAPNQIARAYAGSVMRPPVVRAGSRKSHHTMKNPAHRKACKSMCANKKGKGKCKGKKNKHK